MALVYVMDGTARRGVDGFLVTPVADRGSEQIIPTGRKPDAFEAPQKLALGGGGKHRCRCSSRWQDHGSWYSFASRGRDARCKCE